MTVIRLDPLTDAFGGAVAVAAAELTATAERASHPAARSTGDALTLPRRITSSYSSGTWTPALDLPALPDDCYWRVTVRYPATDRSITRNVTIPGGVLECAWSELVDVDPESAVPAIEAVAGWAATLAAVIAEHAAIIAARDDALEAQTEAGRASFNAGKSAASAWGHANDAADSAEAAELLRNQVALLRDGMVVSATIDGDELVLVDHTGVERFRGNVRGAQGERGTAGDEGPRGPAGLDGQRGLPGADGQRGPAGQDGQRGPAGQDGQAGERGAVGPAGLTWRGTWDPAVDYTEDDAVYFDGSSYFATGDPAVGDRPDATAAWTPLAIRGPQGAPGRDGVDGQRGPVGQDGQRGLPGTDGAEGQRGAAGQDGAAGQRGETGGEGPRGPQGLPGQKGDPGSAGPAGPGIPAGGAAGRILAKSSTADYATAWVPSPGKAARIFKNDRQGFPADTQSQVGLNAAGANDDTSIFTINTAAKQIEVKVAGLYLVSFYGNITASASFALYVRSGNGTYTFQEAGAPSSTRLAASTIVRLAAGDNVQMWCYPNAATAFAEGTGNSKDVGLALAYLGA